MAKKAYSIKIDENILNSLRSIAEKEFRSVNNTIEMGLREYVKQKNKK